MICGDFVIYENMGLNGFNILYFFFFVFLSMYGFPYDLWVLSFLTDDQATCLHDEKTVEMKGKYAFN